MLQNPEQFLPQESGKGKRVRLLPGRGLDALDIIECIGSGDDVSFAANILCRHLKGGSKRIAAAVKRHFFARCKAAVSGIDPEYFELCWTLAWEHAEQRDFTPSNPQKQPLKCKTPAK